MRSSTIAGRPMSAAVPVRTCGGVRRWRRAIGRRMPKLSAVNTANTTSAIGVPRPTSSITAASAAPIANGNRKKLRFSTSATANTTAAISQSTQASMSGRGYPRGGLVAAVTWADRRAAVGGRRGSRECTAGRRRGARRRSLARLDERGGEVVGIERAQVLERLADADQLHRDAELGGDRQRDAALRRAVELREHDAVDRHGLREHLRLAQAVLPCRGVDGQEGLVRRLWELLGDHAPYLRELGHQRVLGVQPPGGIDDDHVGAALAAALDRLEGDRARVRALWTGDDVAARALGPAGELLDGGGAERVGRAEHDALAELALEVPGQLADRRRLAGAVDAGDHDHRRRVGEVDAPLPRLGDRGEQLAQAMGERLATLDLARLGLHLQLRDDLRGRARADVGHDQ